MIAYSLMHPLLCMPLVLESKVERTDRALIAWATMYVLREFDEMLPREDWVIEVLPSGWTSS